MYLYTKIFGCSPKLLIPPRGPLLTIMPPSTSEILWQPCLLQHMQGVIQQASKLFGEVLEIQIVIYILYDSINFSNQFSYKTKYTFNQDINIVLSYIEKKVFVKKYFICKQINTIQYNTFNQWWFFLSIILQGYVPIKLWKSNSHPFTPWPYTRSSVVMYYYHDKYKTA